jgi:hypothetical protein
MADIQFYLALSVIYFAFGIAWGVLCYKHLSELLCVTSPPSSSWIRFHFVLAFWMAMGDRLYGAWNMPVTSSSPVPYLHYYHPLLLSPLFNHLASFAQSPLPPSLLSLRISSAIALCSYRANTQSNAILHIRNNSIPSNRNDSSIRLLPLHQQTRRWNIIPDILIRHRNLISRSELFEFFLVACCLYGIECCYAGFGGCYGEG